MRLRRPNPLLLCLAVLALALAPSSRVSGSAAGSPRTTNNLVLAEEERVYLAEIEHRGLILSRKGFPAIAGAIRSGDAAAAGKFFASDFRGVTRLPENGTGPSLSTLKIHRHADAANSGGASVDGTGFARYLVALRQRFGPDAKVEMALMSFTPLARTNLDGRWRGSGALRLAGALVAGGHGELMANFDFELATVPDVDDVATTPAWVESLRVTAIQQAVAERELFAEVGRERGIDRAVFQDNWLMPPARRSIVTGGVYLSDVDNDGRDDVLVTDAKGLFLFRGLEGGRFEDYTSRSGLPHHLRGVLSAALGDFDGDGWVDLLLPGRAFRNRNGRFEDISGRVRLAFGAGVSGFTVGDYDRDGKLDLYVSRNDGAGQHTGRNSWIDGPGGPGNQLWRNLGDWKFEDVSVKANAQAGRRSVFSAAWLDANNDRWPDIYVINEFGGGELLLNQTNGTFREMPLLDDVGDFGSMGMAVGDIDNDGNIDVYTANMYSKAGRRIFENLSPGTFPPDVWAKIKRFVTGSELYRNHGGLKFERVGKAMRVHAVGWAYGAAFFDADNDGYLDLYGTAGFMSVNKEEPDG